jgi:tRNA modification GTPase
MAESDTIFAPSSGKPPAAIAIVRVSGEKAADVITTMAGRLPPPRRAALCALHHPMSGVMLDRALVLFFEARGSATGEPLAEFHLHGGRAVVAAMEEALSAISGLRRAEPGEFTRRALLAGKIDLAEAEGLGDLLAAETEAQRRAALEAVEGAVGRIADEWREGVLSLSARIEAAIDFSDEDDVAPEALTSILVAIKSLGEEMREALANPPVERLRDGIRVVLAGPPNSGKSTLLNALVQRDAAIVSPIAGTTRDRVEAPVTRAGIAYLLTDTAGLAAQTDDLIERIGIARSGEAILAADIVVWLGDTSPVREDALWVHARADMPGREICPLGPTFSLAAANGDGIDRLWSALHARAERLLPRTDRAALNLRQRVCLGDAAEALSRAAMAHDWLILAEELRQARVALDRLTGRADIEGVLDALFTRFCIGK